MSLYRVGQKVEIRQYKHGDILPSPMVWGMHEHGGMKVTIKSVSPYKDKSYTAVYQLNEVGCVWPHDALIPLPDKHFDDGLFQI